LAKHQGAVDDVAKMAAEAVAEAEEAAAGGRMWTWIVNIRMATGKLRSRRYVAKNPLTLPHGTRYLILDTRYQILNSRLIRQKPPMERSTRKVWARSETQLEVAGATSVVTPTRAFTESIQALC